MTYKTGVDRLRARLQRIYLKNKIVMPDTEDEELLQELSVAQMAINNLYKAKTRVETFTIAIEGSSHLVNWAKDILAAGLPGQASTGGTKMPLARSSEVDIALNTNTYPTKYYVDKVGNELRINYDATLSVGTEIRLLVHERCITLDDYRVLDPDPFYDYADWRDYDIEAENFGGSFKIPEEFDDALIYQAIASWFPEYFQIAKGLGKEADASIMKNVNSQITYLLK